MDAILIILAGFGALFLLVLLWLYSFACKASKERDPPKHESCQTPLGEFLHAAPDADWLGKTTFAGGEVEIWAPNVGGAPSPEFLRRLPDVIQDLPTLDRIIRMQVKALPADISLYGIWDAQANPQTFDWVRETENIRLADEPGVLLRYWIDDDGGGDIVFLFKGRVLVAYSIPEEALADDPEN